MMCDVCNQRVDPKEYAQTIELSHSLSAIGKQNVAIELRQTGRDHSVIMQETCWKCYRHAVGLVLKWWGPEVTAYLMQPGNSE